MTNSHAKIDIKLILQIVLPAFLGSCFLVILTHIVFSGGKRESMAAFAEASLIESSLRAAERPAQHPGEVVTISLNDHDLAQLQSAHLPFLRDVDIHVYADILGVLARTYKPKLIVLNWLGSAHFLSTDKLAPLIRALRSSGMARQILVGFPLEVYPQLPKEFVEEFAIKQAVDCIYDVNRFCTYFTDRPNWMIQSLTEIFWPQVPRYHVSTNLPHFLPNFLLNLPEPESIPDLDFADVLHEKIPPHVLQGKSVFIGSQVTQMHEFRDNKRVVQRTYTAASFPRRNLQTDGIPFHKFWAAMSQMFIDASTIAVPPPWATFAMFICTSSLCIFILLKVGAAAAFGGFLLFSFLYPFLNHLLARYAQVYLPMFPVIYGGFLVLISTAFLQVSINNFRRWQLDALHRAYESNADLKSNFISLISHNLNTPIAKLRGLVDILLTHCAKTPLQISVEGASRLVAKLQLMVRAVLLSTRLKQGGREEMVQPMRLQALQEKFLEEYQKIVQNLGCRVAFKNSFADGENPLNFATLNISSRPVTLALASMALLGQVEGLMVANDERSLAANGALPVVLDLDVLQLGVGLKYLVLRAQIADHQVNEHLLDGLNHFFIEQFNFLGQVLLEFLQVSTSLYDGHFHVLQFGDRVEFEVRLAI